VQFTSCSSCGGSKEDEKELSVTGANNKVYKSYQAACRDNDYDAAHAFLDLLKNKSEEPLDDGLFSSNKAEIDSYKRMYNDGVNYVFKQEMLYLVSDGSTQASDRIIFLLSEAQEYGSINNKIDQVFDMAIIQNNEYLIRKLLTKLNLKSCEKILNADLSNNLNAQVYQRISKIIDNSISFEVCINLVKKNYSDTLNQILYGKISDIIDTTSTFDVCKDVIAGDFPLALRKNAADRIIDLLSSMPIKGKKPISGLLSTAPSQDYVNSIVVFNAQCDDIIDFAIAQDNKSLSRKVLALYKPRPIVNESYSEEHYHPVYKSVGFFKQIKQAFHGEDVQSQELDEEKTTTTYTYFVKKENGKPMVCRDGDYYVYYTKADKEAAKKKFAVAFSKDSPDNISASHHKLKIRSKRRKH
jgi:hypothetical protein